MTVALGYGDTVEAEKPSALSDSAAGAESPISAQPAPPPASSQPPPRREQAQLVFASFVMLFAGLALIRWVTANNVYVTRATNFVLLASFLGLGIGFLNARSSRDYLRWTPVTLLGLVGFVLTFPVILQSLSGPHPLQRLHGAPALPQPVSLGVVFLLTVAVMAGFGQAVARIFVRFRPLTAYRLDIAGSIAGIVVFSVLAFLDLPPAVWGIIAAGGLVVLLLPGVRWWQMLAVAGVAALLIGESFVPHQQWSPYNKLSVQQTGGHTPALYVSANNIPYQAARSLAVMRVQKKFYFYPYQHIARADLANVLIIGAGTGNDAAVALAEGARHVDAVEIDPLLLDLPMVLRFAAGSALAFAPVFLANLVFAQRFAGVETAGTAFAANLLGAMVGGTLEYIALITGYRFILIVIGVLYALAFITGLRSRPRLAQT